MRWQSSCQYVGLDLGLAGRVYIITGGAGGLGSENAAYQSVFLGAIRLSREIALSLGDDGALAFVLSSSVKAPLAGLGSIPLSRYGLASYVTGAMLPVDGGMLRAL